MWEIKWIKDWEKVYSFEFQSLWQNIFNCNPDNQVFFHPEIVKAWFTSYKKVENITPLICHAKLFNIDLILPLVSWKRNIKNLRQRIIIPVGGSEFDYHDPISNERLSPDVIDSFWEELTESIHHNFYFNKLYINGLHSNGLNPILTKEPQICPNTDLTGWNSIDEFIKQLHSSLRGDYNRQVRRLQALGPLSYRVFTPEKLDEAFTELQIFLEFHIKRWPNAYKPPELYKNILKFGLPNNVTHFSTLSIAGIPINWHLGFLIHKRFYYYMHTFNPDFSNYSPGKVHLIYLLEECIKNDVKIFDFLRGDEPYKSGLSHRHDELFQLNLENKSLYSRFKNQAITLLNCLK
jgi:hypothetical protein